MLTAGVSEMISPELVLVDPLLATRARALLPNPEDTFARLEQRRQVNRVQPPLAVSNPDRPLTADEEIGAARRRITELSEMDPPKQRRKLRLVTLVSVSAAWSAIGLLIADLQLGVYQWPF